MSRWCSLPSRARRKVGEVGRDGGHAAPGDVTHHGSDQPAGRGDRDRDVDGAEPPGGVFGPDHVHCGDEGVRPRRRLDHEIVDRNLGVTGAVQVGPQRKQPLDPARPAQVEMRRGALAVGQPRGGGQPDPRVRLVGVGRNMLQGRGFRHRYDVCGHGCDVCGRRRLGSSRVLCARALDVASHDAPVGAGAGDGAQVEVGRAGKAADQRCGEHPLRRIDPGVAVGDDTERVHRGVGIVDRLTWRALQCDRVADLHPRAGLDEEPHDLTRFFGLDVDLCLVGLHGRDDVRLGEGDTLVHLPFRQHRRRGIGGDAWHPQQCRHGQAPTTSVSLAATSSVLAMAARSSTLLMLGDASPPVTRSTGWSSQSK